LRFASSIFAIPVTAVASFHSHRPVVEYAAKTTWSLTGFLHEGRTHFTSTLLPDGRIVVVGGLNNLNIMRSVELYSASSGKWTQAQSLGVGREYHTATLLRDGNVLVASGLTDINNSPKPLATAEIFSPRTGHWISTGAMRAARDGALAALLRNGDVLVAGGSEGLPSRASSAAEIYDPRARRWQPTMPLHIARASATLALLSDGRVLIAGGASGNEYYNTTLASAELYDERTGRWTTTGSMSQAREDAVSVVLPNGDVLVAGGVSANNNSDTYLASAELYNTRSGRWTTTGSMTVPRQGATAALLSDGDVLVTGGDSNDETALASTELYDPHTGRWTLTSGMHVGRFFPEATSLKDGRVLVIGGGHNLFRPDFHSFASAELYTP